VVQLDCQHRINLLCTKQLNHAQVIVYLLQGEMKAVTVKQHSTYNCRFGNFKMQVQPPTTHRRCGTPNPPKSAAGDGTIPLAFSVALPFT